MRIRSRLPSRSPTTALIWARASRIEAILPVCDSQAKTSQSMRRYRGPADQGTVATRAGCSLRYVDGPAEVTLRLPPPLDRPLTVVREDGLVRLLDGEALVAEARPEGPALEPPSPPSLAEAEKAAAAHVHLSGENFAECFTCGIRPEDGLCIHVGPVAGTDAPRSAVDGDRGLAGGRLGGASTAPVRGRWAVPAAARSCSDEWRRRSYACPRRERSAS